MVATGILGLLGTITALLNTIIPILILLGVVWFIVGILQYVIAKGSEDKEKGMHTIIAGIIGLTVIVSMWGLVNFLQQSLGLTNTPNRINRQYIPCVPGNTSQGSQNTLCQ